MAIKGRGSEQGYRVFIESAVEQAYGDYSSQLNLPEEVLGQISQINRDAAARDLFNTLLQMPIGTQEALKDLFKKMTSDRNFRAKVIQVLSEDSQLSYYKGKTDRFM